MSDPFPSSAPPIVDIRRVTRQFDTKLALDDISLTVPRGGVFGLIGGNGAGKTTLIKHILGLLKAQQGTVQVFGLDPVENPVGVLGRIGYLSEDRDLPDWMRVGELMRYTQAFFPNWDEAYAEELREAFDLDSKARIKTLSRGQRARTGLLAALAHRPELLVLGTVLFSSHLLDEVERVADRVAIIHQGRIMLTAPMDEIKAQHRRLTLRFGQSHDQPPSLVGILSFEGRGAEWTYTCSGESDHLRRAAEAIGATVVDDAALSLDEIFVSRIQG